MANLKQFLELFNPKPGNHYLQVTTLPDETTTSLCTLLQSVGGQLDLVVYNQELQEYTMQFPQAKIQQIQNLKQPFRATPRDHDIVIFKDIFQLHSNPEMMLKIGYTTLANAANIIIMEKKGSMNIEDIINRLEKYEFRAPNSIDVLEEYDLVMAKKMHMWGNGL